ncbi:oxygenase MpaB family protein [Sphingomonas sp. S2-65]|uniref:oxygenase MpaB family protein n=1 Tax=Sphingomonas sp. S2-65 TaxID=2903960 RepID=UPI001F40EB25|nr:oxygenase MpaB family protein [Sphingomonas sp. S2-65]UYY59866.1 DUF2236 domain-containing protein [Sphingomonas sp. S2-65]
MIRSLLDRLAAKVLAPEGVDFTRPAGEQAIVPAGSVSWDVYANPVTLYIGGIAAVLLELGEPRVRHGVWDHSSFKRDPAGRLRRTGMAAMVTVYGARSVFEAKAARVNRMHGRIRGTTPEGIAYAADDPELLLWVQVTATWAFLEAYGRYARPLSPDDRDRYFAESRAGAALYGVGTPPESNAQADALFAAMTPKLGPSPVLGEFLSVLRDAPLMPRPLRPLQRLGIRAAVDLVPPPLRERLGLMSVRPLSRAESGLLRGLARTAERIQLPSSPRCQAERRVSAQGSLVRFQP